MSVIPFAPQQSLQQAGSTSSIDDPIIKHQSSQQQSSANSQDIW